MTIRQYPSSQPDNGRRNIRANTSRLVTLYDPVTGVGLDNGQAFPSLNRMDKPTMNSDGAVDIYFGPKAPGEGKNWIATIPDKGFFVALRPYAPTKPFFDQTWKPDDVMKIGSGDEPCNSWRRVATDRRKLGRWG